MTNVQLLSLLVSGNKKINNLSAKQAAVLAQNGFIGVQDGKFEVTSKGQRAHKRNVKAHRGTLIRLCVEKALEELPAGKPFRHRGLWLRMGQNEYTRNEVLEGLKACRELGIVQSRKLSNNNFQIVWFTGDELIPEETHDLADELVDALGFEAAAK